MIPELTREREIFNRVGERYAGQISTRGNTRAFGGTSWSSTFAATLRSLWRSRVGFLGQCHFNIWPETSGLHINVRTSIRVNADRLIVLEFQTFFSARAETRGIFFTAHKDAAASEFVLHRATAERARKLCSRIA